MNQRLYESNGEPGLGWWSDRTQAARAAAFQFEKAQRERWERETMMQGERRQRGETTQDKERLSHAAPQQRRSSEDFLAGGVGDFVLPRAQPITQIEDKYLAKQIASFAKARAREAAKNHAYDTAVGGDVTNADPKATYLEAVSKMGLFDYEELQLGNLLGVGGFSHVYEVTGFHFNGENSNASLNADCAKPGSCTSQKQRAASLSLSPRRPSGLSDRRKSTGGSMVANSTKRKSKMGHATYSEQQQIAREFLAQHALRPVEDLTERGNGDGDLDISNALNGGVSQRLVITRGNSTSGSFYNPSERSREENSAMFRDTRESLSTQLMGDQSTAFFSREFQDELHDAAQGSGKTTPRYAVKHLKPSLLQEQPLPNRFAKAAMDLACEAEMLVALNHPNIVKLRGWATGGPDKLKEGKHTSYFLILDCLTETLQDRIATWRHQHQELYGWRRRLKFVLAKGKIAARDCFRLKRTRHRRNGSPKKCDSPKDKRSASFSKSSSSKSLGVSGTSSITSKTAEELLLIERIKVAYDIACALEYLHEKRVVYRDLKSTNIGFNVRGDVQIFDFGLARYLPRSEMDATCSIRTDKIPKLTEQKMPESEEMRVKDEQIELNEHLQLEHPLAEEEEFFQMSHVGTRRYTAPEVDLKRPYNLKADVYSFGVVLWEIMSMSSAVSKGRKISLAHDHASNRSNHRGRKTKNRRRRAMAPCSCWPLPIQKLVTQTMDDDAKSRPTMKFVRETLEQAYISLTTENPDDPDSQEMHMLKRQRRRSTFCVDTWQREAKNVMEDFLEEDEDDDLPTMEKRGDVLSKSVQSITSHLTNSSSDVPVLSASAHQ
jgi:serine/threonine protein kinase